MTALIIATFILLILASAALATPKPDPAPAWQWKYKVWMPPVWQRLAQCESGSNPPNWKHDSGTYTGAFGFHIGSWQAFKPSGYPARASLASPWQQWRVALRIHDRYGFSGWGCYQGSSHAWVRG